MTTVWRSVAVALCIVFHLKAVTCHGQDQVLRVAAVGDSITWGYRGNVQSPMAWPTQAQSLLGQQFSVVNLGNSGRTLQRNMKDFPGSTDGLDVSWWATPQFETLVSSTWDVVVIMLGTNDAWDYRWDHEGCDEQASSESCQYWGDYEALIRRVRALGTSGGAPDIYIMVPPPVPEDLHPGEYNLTVINRIIPRLVPEIAAANGLAPDHVLDVFNALGGQYVDEAIPLGCFDSFTGNTSTVPTCAYFCDASWCDDLHPDDAGFTKIASVVSTAISEAVVTTTTTATTTTSTTTRPDILVRTRLYRMNAMITMTAPRFTFIIGSLIVLASVMSLVWLRRRSAEGSQRDLAPRDRSRSRGGSTVTLIVDFDEGLVGCESP